jgi:hypothetical protein
MHALLTTSQNPVAKRFDRWCIVDEASYECGRTRRGYPPEKYAGCSLGWLSIQRLRMAGLHLTGGEGHGLVGADHLLPNMPSDTLIADKGICGMETWGRFAHACHVISCRSHNASA